MIYQKTPSALTEFSKSSQNVAKNESCPAQCPADVLISSRNIPEVLWSSFGLPYPCCSGEGFLEVTRFAQAAGLDSVVLMMSLGKASTWYPPNAMWPPVYNTRYCQLIPLYTHTLTQQIVSVYFSRTNMIIHQSGHSVMYAHIKIHALCL